MRETISFKAVYCLVMVVMFFISSSIALACPRDQAQRIHDRLVALPPSIASGDSIGALMQTMNNTGFYNILLKNGITPWTNTAETVYAPLNDSTATKISIIQDDASSNQMKRVFTEVTSYVKSA